jgi:hypothetical protein
MAGDEQEGQKSFKVQDRRRFSADGEARSDVAQGAAPAADPVAPAAPPAGPAAGPAPAAGSGATASASEAAYAASSAAQAAAGAVEITFATVVISFLTQALALLGEIPDPVDGATHVDLEGARQFIDILGILEEKTRGNLDAHEAALLERALYDLRMKYVERTQRR